MSKLWVLIILVIGIASAFYFYSKRPAPTAEDLIVIDSPKPGEIVTSPLTVKGKARGSWYFEASFPVRLEDTNGSVLAQTPAQAQGEWMTNDFVPFEGTLEFFPPEIETGKLIFERDNPSGLPENSASLEVPVRFK